MSDATLRIVRLALPFVRQGATALALAALIAGCECSSAFLVRLTEEEKDALREAHGDGDLPDDVCNERCVPPQASSPDGGAPPTTAEEAGFGVDLCHVVRDASGPAVICRGSYPEACIGGRRPARLEARAGIEGFGVSGGCWDRPAEESASAPSGDRSRAEGAMFGALVRMESASVLAFVELAVDLAAHGAPESLVRRALAAAVDEVRHARAAAGIARAFGAEPERAVVAITGVRTLPALLRDNAVEGVVLEGWGAIAAAQDARTACDPIVHRILSMIAVEEAGHAELACAVGAWASDRAGPEARVRAREAQAEALHGLVDAVGRGATVGLGAADIDRTAQLVNRFARKIEAGLVDRRAWPMLRPERGAAEASAHSA